MFLYFLFVLVFLWSLLCERCFLEREPPKEGLVNVNATGDCVGSGAGDCAGSGADAGAGSIVGNCCVFSTGAGSGVGAGDSAASTGAFSLLSLFLFAKF